jgi:hypothetical protein
MSPKIALILAGIFFAICLNCFVISYCKGPGTRLQLRWLLVLFVGILVIPLDQGFKTLLACYAASGFVAAIFGYKLDQKFIFQKRK